MKCGAMFCGSSQLITAGNQCHPQTAKVLRSSSAILKVKKASTKRLAPLLVASRWRHYSLVFKLEHTSAEHSGPVQHVFQVCPIKTVSIQTADNEPAASSERPIQGFVSFFTQSINVPPLAPSVCLSILPCSITRYPALLVIRRRRRSLHVQVDSLRQKVLILYFISLAA